MVDSALLGREVTALKYKVARLEEDKIAITARVTSLEARFSDLESRLQVLATQVKENQEKDYTHAPIM